MSLELICWGNLPISADLCQETCHTQFHLRGSYLKGRHLFYFQSGIQLLVKKNQGIELLVGNYHGEVWAERNDIGGENGDRLVKQTNK